MKHFRHQKILSLISEFDIETQDELIQKLREAGIEVTQATVSRDLRDLRLVKIATSANTYKYAQTRHEDSEISGKFLSILREAVCHVDYAANFVVLRTYPGMAQAAAAAVDSMEWEDIVGTLAGDDTIFVMMRTPESAHSLVKKIKETLMKRG